MRLTEFNNRKRRNERVCWIFQKCLTHNFVLSVSGEVRDVDEYEAKR